MKLDKHLLTTYFLLFCLTAIGQNLVPNNGFEVYSSLPSNEGQASLAIGWTNAGGFASTDYLHTNGTGLIQLPNSFSGNVNPYAGNAIMGFILWTDLFLHYREYLRIQLSTPLQIGTIYDVSFYLTTGGNNGNLGGFGTDQISVLFTSGPVTQTSTLPILANPQLTYGTIFYNNNWQMISFQYTATAGYDYMTIGNFQNDFGTNTQFFEAANNGSVYYFIDEVTVVPTNTITITGDSTICQGEEAIMSATSNYSSYWWANTNTPNDTLGMDTTLSVFPNSTTSYSVNTLGGISDTFTIYVTPPPLINIGNDTNVCQGDTLTLDATTSNATYLWQDNSTDSTFNVTQDGIYWVEVTVNNCTTVDSININYIDLPTINLGNDTTLCQGDTLTLDATNSNVSYLWQDGSTNSTYIVDGAESVSVTLTSAISGCFNSDTVVFSIDPVFMDIILTDTVICNTSTIVIQASHSGYSNIFWQPSANIISQNLNSVDMNFSENTVVYATSIGITGSCSATDSLLVSLEIIPAPITIDSLLCEGESLVYSPSGTWYDGSQFVEIISLNQEGTYTYSEEHTCGTTIHEISIEINSCGCGVYIPNALTPNGDEHNNAFSVVSDCVFQKYHLTIYNRRGKLIFETYDENEYWDATYNGNFVQDGVYTWKLSYTDTNAKEPSSLVGHVVVLR